MAGASDGRRGAADAEGAAGGAPRPARRARAAGARARRGRGRDLPPRRGAGARTRGDGGDAAARRARAPGARSAPTAPQLAGEDGFRFRHLLIRDAAYDALPKAIRADLHERFADWLEEHGQASSSWTRSSATTSSRPPATRRELGQPIPTLADRAAARLAAAGRRAALARGQARRAAVLLERALELTRPLRLDVLLEVDLAATPFIAGRAPRSRDRARRRPSGRCRARRDRRGCSPARSLGYHRFNATNAGRRARALALKALPLLERAANHAALVHVWEVLAIGVANGRGRMGGTDARARRAGAAPRAPRGPAPERGCSGSERRSLSGRARRPRRWQQLDELLPATPCAVLAVHAGLAARDARPLRRGRPARPGVERAPARAGRPPDRRGRSAEIARLAGRPRGAAAGHLRTLCAWLEEREQHGFLSTYVPCSAASSCARPLRRSRALARRGRELGQEDDIDAGPLAAGAGARPRASRRARRRGGGSPARPVGERRADRRPLRETRSATSPKCWTRRPRREAADALAEALERYSARGTFRWPARCVRGLEDLEGLRMPRLSRRLKRADWVRVERCPVRTT